MTVHKRSARGKIVQAAEAIAEHHNCVGALDYIERRVMTKRRERRKNAKMLRIWRKTYLDNLKDGLYTSMKRMLFRYTKMVERMRDGITPDTNGATA